MFRILQNGKISSIIAIAIFLALFEGAALAAGWSAAGGLFTARSHHTSTLLPDGRVMVAGGFDSTGAPLDSVELYDPATNSWSAARSLNISRQYHTATLLADGRVLIAGGSNGTALESAELYDPFLDNWSAAGNLNTARRNHTATLLADGRVLVAGGSNESALNTAELYDPDANSWSPAENAFTFARYGHTTTLLADGRVLIAGGSNGDYLDSAELYNPADGTWSAAGFLNTARSGHIATLLAGGMLLIAGGGGSAGYLADAELYDPSSGISTNTAPLNTGRRYHTATLLPDGQLLIAGGHNESALNSAELYDPVANTWSVTNPPLAVARSFHTATMLADGRVLVAGGHNGNYLNSAELYDPSITTWSTTGILSAARGYHNATLLDNGRILITGGYGSLAGGGSGYLNTSDLYDPATDTWSAAASFPAARYRHTATLLAGGRVLATGGYNTFDGYLNSTELYDPGTDTWTAAAPLATSRYMHTATMLADGRILIAGGFNSAGGPPLNTELYDPAEGTWSAAGPLNIARSGHTATLLADGRVLIAGGYGNEGYLKSAELYDPSTDIWSLTDPLTARRYYHTATLLADGRILVAAGYNGGYLNSTELYDPATETWSPAATLIDSRDESHTATLLANGRVLVAGGYGSTGFVPRAELYDPATDTWSPAGSLSTPRRFHTATLLADGRIVIAGGVNNFFVYVNSADLYERGLGFDNDWRPAIAYMPSPVTLPESFSFTGSGFRGTGNTEASSGGTNSSAANFPLVQVRSAGNGQTQWLVPRNFTATGYTAEPLGDFPVGPAWITVFVNGIPGVARYVAIENSSNDEKQPATVTLGSLDQVYNGEPKQATATTSPAGLSVDFTYDGAAAAPTVAGSYVVVGTINDANYQGSATDVMTINKAEALIILGSLNQVYDGEPRQATATTSTAGLGVDFTYDGSAAPPTAAGSYTVVGTINDANYQGSATDIMTISKAEALVSLGSLNQNYDGEPKAVTATTVPDGLAVDLTYNDSAAAPADAGSYTVEATVNDTNYSGTASGLLVISRVLPAITTTEVSSITATAAFSGGNVTAEGGAEVTERGICWDTNGSPTLADSCTGSGSGPGVFVGILSSLAPGTTYYARAYATNSAGTAYGNEISFITKETWSLTITLEGKGSGTVSIDPSSIECASDCDQLYEDSTQIILTASPEGSSKFTGWSGDPDCEDGIVNMTRNIICTANFYYFPWPIFMPAITNAIP